MKRKLYNSNTTNTHFNIIYMEENIVNKYADTFNNYPISQLCHIFTYHVFTQVHL
jgi:hypothetical protein